MSKHNFKSHEYKTENPLCFTNESQFCPLTQNDQMLFTKYYLIPSWIRCRPILKTFHVIPWGYRDGRQHYWLTYQPKINLSLINIWDMTIFFFCMLARKHIDHANMAPKGLTPIKPSGYRYIYPSCCSAIRFIITARSNRNRDYLQNHLAKVKMSEMYKYLSTCEIV